MDIIVEDTLGNTLICCEQCLKHQATYHFFLQMTSALNHEFVQSHTRMWIFHDDYVSICLFKPVQHLDNVGADRRFFHQQIESHFLKQRLGIPRLEKYSSKRLAYYCMRVLDFSHYLINSKHEIRYITRH